MSSSPSSSTVQRIVPLVVACPLFLQNIDASVMGTALPTIAASLHVDVLRLNLAITSYLLSLVIFLPTSAWLADRFGARRVFCLAVGLFSAASALCGAATSLPELVAYRLLQGIGGAMMVPVGRLILLQSIEGSNMMRAMVWFTIPGAIGRLVGPFLGGAVVTVLSWRWIFAVNVPFGILGVLLALRYIAPDRPRAAQDMPKLHASGMVWMALALGGLLGALEMSGKQLLPGSAIAAMAVLGALSLLAYVRSSRSRVDPLIDLAILRFRTYRTATIEGMPLRVAIGTTPFVLPILFQVAFGMPPLESGSLTLAVALGSLGTRSIATPVVGRFGERATLIGSALLATLFFLLYATFTAGTAPGLIFAVLCLAGASNSMVLLVLASTGFGEIPPKRMGHATALAAMAQQLAAALGVTVSASLIQVAHLARTSASAPLTTSDFRLAMIAIAVLPLLSAAAFWRMPRTAEASDPAGPLSESPIEEL